MILPGTRFLEEGMSDPETREKHRQRRRNKWAKDLNKPWYRQRVVESKKKKPKINDPGPTLDEILKDLER